MVYNKGDVGWGYFYHMMVKIARRIPCVSSWTGDNE